MREYVRGFGTYPNDTMKPMASLGGYQFFPNKRYATTMFLQCQRLIKVQVMVQSRPMVTVFDTKRIFRKTKLRKQSQINIVTYIQMKIPKGTIHGLGFTDKKKAKQSLSKIRNSGRTHAHKMRTVIAMSQRAKVASQRAKDPEKKKIWDRHIKRLSIIYKQKQKE